MNRRSKRRGHRTEPKSTPVWTVEDDRREELIAASELTLNHLLGLQRNPSQ